MPPPTLEEVKTQLKASENMTYRQQTQINAWVDLQAGTTANRIMLAAHFASAWHAGQKRKHKDVPYTEHLLRVAGRVMLRADATEDMVCAAFLHDAIEDQATSPEREAIIQEGLTRLGGTVPELVHGLTNSKIPGPRAHRKKMDRARLATQSREVKLIKLIDRIDNLTESLDDCRLGLDKNWAFNSLYADESAALLEVLKGVDSSLELELVFRAGALKALCVANLSAET